MSLDWIYTFQESMTSECATVTHSTTWELRHQRLNLRMISGETQVNVLITDFELCTLTYWESMSVLKKWCIVIIL